MAVPHETPHDYEKLEEFTLLLEAPYSCETVFQSDIARRRETAILNSPQFPEIFLAHSEQNPAHICAEHCRPELRGKIEERT